MGNNRLQRITNLICNAVSAEVKEETKRLTKENQILRDELDESKVVDDDNRLAYLLARKEKWDLEKIEALIIQRALEIENGHMTNTSARLGMTWQALDRRVKKYKLNKYFSVY